MDINKKYIQVTCNVYMILQWRHIGRDSVSNHQPHDCFLNCLFRHRSKKSSKLRVTGICAGNSSEAGEFPTQMASNADFFFIWWRHHDTCIKICAGDMQYVSDICMMFLRIEKKSVHNSALTTGQNSNPRVGLGYDWALDPQDDYNRFAPILAYNLSDCDTEPLKKIKVRMTHSVGWRQSENR